MTNNDAVPTFGEIYRQNSGYQQQQQQHVQVQRGPIIETPNSTIKSTTIVNRANSLNNGPIITPLSPTSSDINLATTIKSGGVSSSSRKQKFSSSSSSYRQAQYSSQQQQQQHQQASFNRVPVVNAANSSQLYLNNSDTERHFIPINVQEQKNYSSSYTDYGPNNYRGYQQHQTTIIS